MIKEQENNYKYPYIYSGLIFTVLFIFLYQLGGEVISSFFPKDNYKIYLPYINAFSQILFMIIPVWVVSNLNPLGRNTCLRLKIKISKRELLISLLGLFGFQFFTFGWTVIQLAIIPEFLKVDYLNLVKKSEELYIMLLGGNNILDGIRAIAVGAIIPAIAEELLFRGFLQRSLEERITPKWAIFITALTFSIIHFIPTNIIPLLVIGVFFGIVAQKTGSIILPMILHFCNNAIAIIGIFILKDNKADTISNTSDNIFPAIVFFIIGTLILLISCKEISKRRV